MFLKIFAKTQNLVMSKKLLYIILFLLGFVGACFVAKFCAFVFFGFTGFV